MNPQEIYSKSISFSRKNGQNNFFDKTQISHFCTKSSALPGDALGESSAAWIRLALVPNLTETQEALNLWQRERDLGNL